MEADSVLAGEDERVVYAELCKRGATFQKALKGLSVTGDMRRILMELAEKGLVCADSFVPVRQWIHRSKLEKASARQRVNARIAAMSAGRWDIVHPLKARDTEKILESFFQENIILCRETFRRSLSMREKSELELLPDWSHALELLRIWEFTGRVRRGYFVKGLSGAQFIRKQDYESVVRVLARPDKQIIWLNAADPMQLWGKVLTHLEGRSFMNIPGTAVALRDGIPVMVLERQGRILRVFGETNPEEVLKAFYHAFQDKAVFPEKKRLIVKEYPADVEDALKNAGFIREMLDYVLYR